ncbi:Fusicoccadiene synthase [Psilocybe cubensis]|uniref:Isoprenoid synthase domain-containing protein n=2 Tax=Psilocybe cubensis TaxID=181762 RepID=A0A8H7Y3S1_PSICU|nr:Fusicoccadiene synthase [Psilocybe cubensis]KAH9484642.1 Fusicoccadiene synthase [Psilocybe cubensis]
MACVDTNNLADERSKSFVWPISYGFDYMSDCVESLPLSKDNSDAVTVPFPPLLMESDPKVNDASISLHPADAGLPWHTSIPFLRQTKHWRSVLSITRRLLELFADAGSDDTASKICLDIDAAFAQGMVNTWAEVAKAEIPIIFDSWSRFNAYFWVAADERRVELMTAANGLIIIFDDVWETKDSEAIHKIQAEFLSRFKVRDSGRGRGFPNVREEDTTPLQAFITDVIQGFYEEDTKGGNGGKEVVDRMVEFINHRPPAREFTTLREFLDYRIKDAAVEFTFTGVKFSLRSNVNMESPRIARFMSLASDHVCYVNDLGSYDKEKAAYERGEIVYMLNAVDFVRRMYNLPDDRSAKRATLQLQMQLEREMASELDRLQRLVRECSKADEAPSMEELEFVEAVVYIVTGNIFTSVVMSRYGGKAARLSL